MAISILNSSSMAAASGPISDGKSVSPMPSLLRVRSAERRVRLIERGVAFDQSKVAFDSIIVLAFKKIDIQFALAENAGERTLYLGVLARVEFHGPAQPRTSPPLRGRSRKAVAPASSAA